MLLFALLICVSCSISCSNGSGGNAGLRYYYCTATFCNWVKMFSAFIVGRIVPTNNSFFLRSLYYFFLGKQLPCLKLITGSWSAVFMSSRATARPMWGEIYITLGTFPSKIIVSFKKPQHFVYHFTPLADVNGKVDPSVLAPLWWLRARRTKDRSKHYRTTLPVNLT